MYISLRQTRVPLATEIMSGSGGTTAMDPVSGPSWEVRNHAHKHGKLKKGDTPSTSSRHGEAVHSRTHKHDKKTYKPVDLPV